MAGGPRGGYSECLIEHNSTSDIYSVRMRELIFFQLGRRVVVSLSGKRAISNHIRYILPIFGIYSFFSRDVLEAKSEKTKIAWPKNEKPKMPQLGLQKHVFFFPCLTKRKWRGQFLESRGKII